MLRHLVGNMVGREKVVLLTMLGMVGMASAGGKYWWMGTDAFRGGGDTSAQGGGYRGKRGRQGGGDLVEGTLSKMLI